MKNLIKAATEFFENALLSQINQAEIATQIEALEYNTQLVAVTGNQEQANEVIAMAVELAKADTMPHEITDLLSLHYRIRALGFDVSDLDKLIQIRRIMGVTG